MAKGSRVEISCSSCPVERSLQNPGRSYYRSVVAWRKNRAVSKPNTEALLVVEREREWLAKQFSKERAPRLGERTRGLGWCCPSGSAAP